MMAAVNFNVIIFNSTQCNIGYYRISFASESKNWNLTLESSGVGINFTSVVSVDHNERFFANITVYNEQFYKTGELAARLSKFWPIYACVVEHT